MDDCTGLSDIVRRLLAVEWLEWAKVVFDLLKGVAWPLAAFLIVWIFREPIRARIPDIVEVGPTGAVFKAGPIQPAGHASNPLQTADHPLPTVNALAGAIQSELQAFIPEQRELRLVRALAEARIMAEFEFVFASIFQSQLDALKELIGGPRSLAEAQAYFVENVLPLNKELFASMGFDAWVRYLLVQGLALVEGDEVSITQKGIDFMDFVGRYKTGFFKPN